MIMLIDNNISDMKRLKECVEICYPNSEVAIFLNSEDALRYIQSENSSVDLCFTAVVMSGVSGFKITEALKKKDKRARIVFFCDTAEYANDAWRLYVNDYLLKPITAEKVRHTLKSCETA